VHTDILGLCQVVLLTNDNEDVAGLPRNHTVLLAGLWSDESERS
jgi:hypothetical protein